MTSNQTCVTYINPCLAGYFGSVLATYQCVQTCPEDYHSNNLNNLCVSDCTTNS